MSIFLNQSSPKSTTETFRSWDKWEIFLLVLLIFGIFGNTLMVILMRSERMRRTNESLLNVLIGVLNISFLLIKFLVNLQKIYKIRIYSACIIFHFVLPQIIAWEVYWLIVLLTIERYMLIARPFEISWIKSRSSFKSIVVSMLVAFSILSSTQAICLKYDEKKPYYCSIREKENTTDTQDVCSIYMKNIFIWIKSPLMSWVPWAILNVLIILNMCKFKSQNDNQISNDRESVTNWTQLNSIFQTSIKNRNKHVNATVRKIKLSKKNQITIVLCIISFTFFILTGPFTILEVLRKMKLDDTLKNTLTNRTLHRFSHFLLDLLHVSNFIFYFIFSHGFRLELSRLFFSKCFISNSI
jgi:hypothetical protein